MDNKNEDNIRPPDSVKIDRLINDDYEHNNNNHIQFNQNYDLNTVLEMSKNEFLVKEQLEMELLCIELKEQHHKELQNKFNNLKIQLNKIILFDRPNIDYYELVLSIIEMYELGVISEYKTNLNEYTNIFRLLKTIRLPNDELENLKKIITYE